MAALLPIPGISKYFGRFLGNAISAAAGVAIGEAMSPALQPRLQSFKNDQMAANPHVPPDPGTLAAGVAQGQVSPEQAAAWAKQHGYDTPQFNALVDIANVGPPLALAYDAWRRGDLGDEEFSTALKRTGLEDEWNSALVALKDHLYDLAALANGMQQGFVPDAGLLQGAPNVGASTVEQNAPLNIDPIVEAKKLGYSSDQLKLAAELAGLPPGPSLLQDWVRRGAASAQDLVNGVRQGHTKSEWAQKYLDTLDHVLGHLDYVEARVRGYLTNAEMYAGGKLTGWTPENLDLLHKTHGRPLSWHQVWIGLARGGKRLDPTADMSAASTGIDPDFFAALQQSNIQQQWYDLAWSQRYTYPAAFVLRTLATSGDLTQAETEQILLYEGWEPTLAAKVSAKWSGGTTTTAAQKKQTLSHLTDEYLSGALSRAALTTALTALGYTAQQATDEINLAEFNASKAVRTKATTAIGKRYIALQLSQAEAEQDMAALGWPQGAIDKYIAGWNAERDDEGTTLTQAQVLWAYKKGTLAGPDALARLTVLGSSAADAQTLLDSQ